MTAGEMAGAPADGTQPVAERATEVLRALVGDESAELRGDQWRAIEALVVQRRRALVVQRTGWGKSAVYFVATALLRSGVAGRRPAGPTLIISPLLALMRDQVAAAVRAGFHAVSLTSANVAQWREVEAAVVAGEADVLLCSPERLNAPGFREDVLPGLAATVGLVVVDEAHCISDWGHDFRPDYRRIRTLLGELAPGVPVLATTATANDRVSADVAEQLGGAEVDVLRGGLDRSSLRLGVVALPDVTSRVAWLSQRLASYRGSGIVYVLTVAQAEELAEQLQAAGHEVAAYTGRTDPARREELEAALRGNELTALVATSALGMGFDKPDLGFVIHLGAPSSPVSYYQQVGRAGRAVADAEVVLLPGEQDVAIWDYFASTAFPPEKTVRAVLAALGDEPMSTARLQTVVDERPTRLEAMLKVLDVDGVVRRVRGGWQATGQPWEYDAERYARVAATRRHEQQAMLDYVTLPAGACRMAYLREQLNDPELVAGWRCGRCDLCGGLTLEAAVAQDAIAGVRARASRPGTPIAPRRQWPTGMSALGVPLQGRISPGAQAGTGRAVARLDGLGWSTPLRAMLEPGPDRSAGTEAHGGHDGEVPRALRDPVRQVVTELLAELAAADESPHGVVAVGSATRPILVAHLARGVGQVAELPFVGALQPSPGSQPGRHDVNSAVRLAAVYPRLQLGLDGAALSGLEGRRVLLVDDYRDSGWTLTIGAQLLREAGAAGVYPVVLAQR